MTTVDPIYYPDPKMGKTMNITLAHTNHEDMRETVETWLEHTQCWKVEKPRVVDDSLLAEIKQSDGGAEDFEPHPEYDDNGNELELVKELWVTKECTYVGKATRKDMLMMAIVVKLFSTAAKMYDRE
jgi:hypothetical protein